MATRAVLPEPNDAFAPINDLLADIQTANREKRVTLDRLVALAAKVDAEGERQRRVLNSPAA